ncbi:MAG: glutathione S-transferase family protein, partial [Candidatus Binatia bacterium]
VRIVLAMKNVPYEIVDVKQDDRKSLIAFSGQRKVPTMDYDGQCIIDSTFISALLEEKYPEKSIYPKGEADKALCLMLEDWSDEVLIQANHALRRAETPEARKQGEQLWESHFQNLDHFLKGKKFIFGEITIADISIFSQLHYLYTVIKQEVPASYKNLHAWMDLMRRTLNLPSLYDAAA